MLTNTMVSHAITSIVIRHNINRFTLNRHTSSRDRAGSLDHCMNCANTLIGSGADEQQRKQMHHLLVSRHEHAYQSHLVIQETAPYAWQVLTFMTHHKIIALQTCHSGNCSIYVASVHLDDTPQDHDIAECLLALHMVIHAKHHTHTIGSDALVCVVIHLHMHNM